MSDFLERVVGELQIRMIAAGQDPDVLEVNRDQRKLQLPLANGARLTMTAPALLGLGPEPWQVAAEFYEPYCKLRGL